MKMSRNEIVELEQSDGTFSRGNLVAAKQELDELELVLKKVDNMINEIDKGLPAFTMDIDARHRRINERIIPVYCDDVFEARSKGSIILSKIYREYDQDPKTALRLPGLIASNKATIDLLKRINEIKARFKEYATSVSESRYIARKILRQRLGDVHLNQCYREIIVLENAPRSVTFYWSKNSYGIKQKTVAEVINEIRQELEKGAPPTEEGVAWRTALEIAKKKIASYPKYEILAKREPVAPNPKAQIYFEGIDEPLTKSASMPIFYLHSHGDLPPIEPLGPMDSRVRRAIRKDIRVEADPLCKRLSIYRYKEQYRTCQKKLEPNEDGISNE